GFPAQDQIADCARRISYRLTLSAEDHRQEVTRSFADDARRNGLPPSLSHLFTGGGRDVCPVGLREQARNPGRRNDPTAGLTLRPTGHPSLPLVSEQHFAAPVGPS